MTDDEARAEHYGLQAQALRDAPAGPITLVNLFRLRATASDSAGQPRRTGAEALLDDPEYREAYEHRRAAVERQHVIVSASPG